MPPLKKTAFGSAAAKLFTWAVLGALVGVSCVFLPERYRGACVIAAKLIGAFK